MKKTVKILLVTMALLFVLPVAVSAAAPYTTYTYSSTGFVLYSPDAYVPDQVVDAAYIGQDRNGNSVTIEDPRDLQTRTETSISWTESRTLFMYWIGIIKINLPSIPL